MLSTFVYSVIFLFIASIMWSFEGSQFTDNGKKISILLLFKFSKWFFIILAFAAPIAI